MGVITYIEVVEPTDGMAFMVIGVMQKTYPPDTRRRLIGDLEQLKDYF